VSSLRAQQDSISVRDSVQGVRDEAEFDAFLDALTASEAAEMTPDEVAGGNGAPGIQGGATQIRIRVEGTPQTLVRDDPDDPRDTPPPTIYGEEILCPATAIRGQFEPAQGVWQDDPTFVDKPGKQLFRVSPVLFRAELPMVTGRNTLLFGVERAVGGAEPRRNEIFIKGEATGTVALPVRFRFTLKQIGGEEELYVSPVVGQVPLGGECGTHTSFEVKLDVTEGVPPDRWFRFKEDGNYIIEAELVTEDERPTGIKVSVTGRSVTTHAPSLAFRVIAIMPSSTGADRLAQLQERARALERKSKHGIPDLFPVISEPLNTHLYAPLDRSDLLNFARRSGKRARVTRVIEQLDSSLVEEFFNDIIREDLMRQLQVAGLMSGWDRIIVLMTTTDFGLLLAGTLDFARVDAMGFADPGSRKILYVDIEASLNPYSTVAHEIVHTLPWDWTGEVVEWMPRECGIHYHGTGDDIAHGHQITEEGIPERKRRDYSQPVMGHYDFERWITQCTYRHLLEVLSAGVPDPRVLLVQGFVARHEGRSAGSFLPFYDLDGVVDLPAGGPGSWAVVLRDGAGDVLARHAWEPQWHIPDIDIDRSLMAFAFRLPSVEGIARVDLESPDGLLDSLSFSASAPSVRIVSPPDGAAALLGDDGIRVEWSGSDADGDSLLYTVLYSSDGGARWMDVAVEIEETSARVPLDPEALPDAHRVLVRATDGGRSSDAVIAFRSPE
jgi:hypothetical protein